MDNEQRIQQARQYWDSAAPTFDNEPDHGLRNSLVRQAWIELLTSLLPVPPASILDIGCGTGSLTLVMAELGYDVTGCDLSAAMIAQATAKTQASGYNIPFKIMDAFYPDFPEQQFNAVVGRHLLWVMPDTAVALQRWSELLTAGGRLLLIEGYWHTGGGLHAQQVVEALPPHFTNAAIKNLSDQPTLWGGAVTDERYVVVATQNT